MKRSNYLLVLVSISIITVLSESCSSKDGGCPTINCNTGTVNEQSCECDCPNGFSGINCEIEDRCVTRDIECLNGGTCIDGSCECPEGYLGNNCEIFDSSKVQVLLDAGHTPIALYNGGVPLDSLYGKTYKGGLIFYLNTTDGTGLVAATAAQDTVARWGCVGTDIPGLPNVSSCADDCTPPEPEDTAVGARIGDGPGNTDAILAGCDDPGPSIAAELCRSLGAEWFLPSRGELYLMYTNLYLQGYGGFTSETEDRLYWSSTEVGYKNGSAQDPENNAWTQGFYGDGQQGYGTKFSDTIHVRAAKQF